MRAIDTNVVVRYLTRDDPVQAARAKEAVDAGDVFIGTTVLLETEWVLRSAYGFASPDVVRALSGLAGLPGVSVESPTQLAEALQRTQAGMDFADALHLGAASRCEAMLTFDSRFIEAAGSAAIPVIEP